ncbi:hypothetical protein BGX26_006237 [Mortierella sp. AD094]|nr:hypothetical protein BGX26_006237 [Mortierella sp. AD094]
MAEEIFQVENAASMEEIEMTDMMGGCESKPVCLETATAGATGMPSHFTGSTLDFISIGAKLFIRGRIGVDVGFCFAMAPSRMKFDGRH